MSNTLPWRTLATPSTPSDFSAPSIALPCGSRMPDFRVTVTRAFTIFSSEHDLFGKPVSTFPDHASALHQHRAAAGRPLVLHQDAQTLGDFGIGLQQPTEVTAETILVELLVGFDVPQPARIRRNLVGDDDPHHLVFEQPAALHLEVDEANTDAEEKPCQEVVDADGKRHDVVDLLRRGPSEGGDV